MNRTPLAWASLFLFAIGCSDKAATDKLFCQGEPCPDNQGCLAPACDSQTGECIYEADDSRCFAGEICDPDGGNCIPAGCSLPIHCVDGIPCTDDFCEETTRQCKHIPNDELCQPGFVCDPLQGCIEFHCTTNQDCDDNNPCTSGSCEGGDCIFVHIDCTRLADECNLGVCDPASGTCIKQPVPDGKICDDLDACTERTECLDGQCTGIPTVCIEDSNPCTVATCDPASGQCVYLPDDGAYCDDQDECTVGDRCLMDECKGVPFTEDQDGDYYNDWPCGDDCDPMNPFTNPGAPEICDGQDNDCNGLTDESANSTDTGTICACLDPCGDDPGACTTGSDCLEVPGLISVCVQRCSAGDVCPDSSGATRTCMSFDLEGNAVSICVCELPQCPLNCTSHLECLPYGLTDCLQGECTGFCETDMECPPSMDCLMNHCRCPAMPDSCLSCDPTMPECPANSVCTPRPDPAGMEYFECEFPCFLNEECPYLAGRQLYCHIDATMGAEGRCACAPIDRCAFCDDIWTQSMECFPSWMDCQELGDQNTFLMACSTPCFLDQHCPPNWHCWDDGQYPHGWCIEAGCHCEPDLHRVCVSNDDCLDWHPEFMCIPDPDGTADPFCTKFCGVDGVCPLGYYCDFEVGPAEPICRCD